MSTRASRDAIPGVIVPARLDYALRGLISLALATGERTKIDVIAGEHGVSRKFLAHTLTALRDAGVVVTQRGMDGGYRLARPPEDITVAEVFDACTRRSRAPPRTSGPTVRPGWPRRRGRGSKGRCGPVSPR